MNNGEIKAYQLLEQNGWLVEDLTSDERYFSKDIDLRISNANTTHTIEVKWDSRISDTGNMFIETFTDIDKCKKGWFLFCQADYIFYGDSKNNLFYVFKTQDLREYLNHTSTEIRKAPDYTKRGRLKKVSQGQIVPIEDFKASYNVYVVQLQNISTD